MALRRFLFLLCLALGSGGIVPEGFCAGAGQVLPSVPIQPSAEEAALRAAAEKGDPEAQYSLAVALLKPIPPHIGPVKEGAEAAKWLEKSAEAGSSGAAFLLGYMHQYAVGVAKDTGKALPWLTRAADQGNAAALVTLGVIYRIGDGVIRNRVKARDYYAKAAEQGNNNARTALATMYMEGDGVPRDAKLALSWFRRAVRDGHAPAMLGLGTLHAKRELGMQNGPRAMYWTHQAVAHGYVPAVYALGLLYRDGVGNLAPDAYKAYLWLKLADELSGPRKEQPYWLENASRALTAGQRKKADAELAGWLQNGPPAPPAREPE